MKILVIGNSHSKVFNHYKGNKYNFNVREVLGATARGAINPNTRTNSLQIFQNFLKENNDYDKIFIVLGEVDCGYLIWYKYLYENLDPTFQMEESIHKLKDFVITQVLTYFNPQDIFLLSSIPPVMQDNTNPNFLEGARSKVTTSIEDRLDLTLKYNNSMGRIATELKCNHLDITSYVLDYKTKRVKKEWLREDPNNHHLNTKSIDLWITEFEKFL